MSAKEQLSALEVPDVAEMRTEFSRTERLPDGSYETALSSVPLHYQDSRGDWKRIEHELKQQANGAFVNGANSVDVNVPARADRPVEFSADGERLSFRLVGASDAPAVADRGAAEFENSVGDVDLRYEMVGRALKESLVLPSPSVPSVYRYAVESDGLAPRLAPSGAVLFEDAAGNPELGFAAPWMRDAAGVVSRAIRYEIEKHGEQSQIGLRIDRDWLNAPERRFPVVVDPTVYRYLERVCEIRNGRYSNVSLCDGALDMSWVGRDEDGIIHRNLMQLEDLAEAVPEYVQVIDGWFASYLGYQTPSTPSNLDLHHLTRGFSSTASWNRFDGRTLWTTLGGDYNPEREARRSTADVLPDERLLFDITELSERLVRGEETSHNLLLKAADETRQHLSAFYWSEARVRWTAWTGASPRFRFSEHLLSDGSVLRFNLGNWNTVLESNDIDLESDDGRFAVGRFYNSHNRHETEGTHGRASRGDFGSISLERNVQDGSYLFRGPSADDGVFHKRNDGTFAPPRGYDATLVENLDGTTTVTFNDTTEIWTFDAVGRLVQTRQDYGYTIDATYGPDGLSTLRDSLGNSATFAYDSNGDMRTVTDEQGAIHRYDYDSEHCLIAYTSPTGRQTRYTYDSTGRLERISLPDRTAVRIAYHDQNSLQPRSITPVDATGNDQAPTRFAAGFDWSRVAPPGGTSRVYFHDPYDLIVDLVQTGRDAAIAATGQIPGLHGRYIRSDTQLSVDVSAAQVPDGIQLAELEVNGVEVDSIGDAPCDEDTCPTRARTTLAYDPTDDPDGTYNFTVNTIDGDGERTDAPAWSIAIDSTAPTQPTDLLFAEVYASDPLRGQVHWTRGVDPEAPDRTPGSGIVSDEVRYSVDGGVFTNWVATDQNELEITGIPQGARLDVEVRSIDAVGNVSLTARDSVIVGTGSRLIGVTDYYFDEYGDPVDEDGNPITPSGGGLGALDLAEDKCRVGGRAQAPRLASSDGESDVIIASHVTVKCDSFTTTDDPVPVPVRLFYLKNETCLRMYRPSPSTNWPKQVCETLERDQHTVVLSSNEEEVARYAVLSPDMMCRADRRRYRTTSFIKVRYVYAADNRTLADTSYVMFESDAATHECNNAGAFRYAAKHTEPWSPDDNPNGWKRVGQARNVTPSVVLGRRIREDRPDSPYPNAWHAHHIVPTGYARSGLARDAQALAYRCRINGNQAENGVWLRGPGLRDNTPERDELPDEYRHRAYHLSVHTRAYFRNVATRLARPFSSGECERRVAEDELVAIAELLRTRRGKQIYAGTPEPPDEDD